MKIHFTALATALAATLTALAAVPLEWTVHPRNPAPAAFDRHHGETLDFRCTFAGFGVLPFTQGADIRLWYQTNGMGSAWWSIPAAVSSNVLSATFPPQADPGTDRLSLFFGAPSNAYASAVLRLRHSPGFAPNVLPPPDVTTWADELAAVRALIDYSTANAALVATIEASARPVTRIVTEDGTRIMDATGSVFAVSSTPGVFVATNLFLMAPGVEFVFTNINAIAWGLVGGNATFQQTIKYLAYDATTGRWLALGPSFGNYLAPEYVAGFNASFQSPTDTPFDAPSFGLYDRGFIGDASHLEGTFYRVTGSAITSLVDRILFASDAASLTPGNYEIVSNRAMSAIRVETDPTVPAWAKSATPPPSMTTNVVRDIVTNELPAMAAEAVYDVHDLRWDEEEQILYWCKFVGGHDLCIAVTNINLTHPTNAVLLKKWRETNR